MMMSVVLKRAVEERGRRIGKEDGMSGVRVMEWEWCKWEREKDVKKG